MNKIGAFHAPASFAFRGKSLTVQTFLPDGEYPLAELTLCYTVTASGGKGGKSGRLRMLPVDGFTARDSYSLYRARIPAEALLGGELFYSFLLGGEESETYTVPLCDMPAMPPLLITELSPWGGVHSFMELYNPTEKAVDLFGYDLLLFTNGEPMGRNRLANAQGVNLLAPHSAAALRFITPELLMTVPHRGALTADGFYADLAKAYPGECDDLAELAPTLMQVDITAPAASGDYRLAEGTFNFPYSFYRKYRYDIVPHGADASEALFTLSLNEERVDLRRTRSVQVDIDPRSPKNAIVTAHIAPPTPGYPGEGQGYPDLADTQPPAILPLEPEGRYHLNGKDLKIRFAVIGEAVRSPAVYLRVGKRFCRFAATFTTEGVYEVTVPYRTLLGIGARLEYYIEATGGLYTACCGSRVAPLSLRVSDSVGPLIIRSYPAEGEVLENERKPRIVVEYTDFSGINPRISILCLDGKNLSDKVKWGKNHLEFLPEHALSYGNHVLELSLRDMTGNRTYRRIAFTVAQAEGLRHYRGEVHAHSVESDGQGLFDEAYDYAHRVGGVDFFAITDHSQFLSDAEYESQRTRALAHSRDGFVAFSGQEVTWSHREGNWGHMNLLEYPERISSLDTDLPTLYERISDDEQAIAMFNHPCDLWGDFDNFGHLTASLRERVCLIEVRGRAYRAIYARALAKGWRVAPVFNDDTHSREFITEKTGMSVLLAHALTRENLLTAVRRRRAYSTIDGTLRLSYRVNGAWLGSELEAPNKLTVTVDASTENPRGLGHLALLTENLITVAEVNAGVLREFSWQIELDPDFDYYYLEVTNGEDYAVTAPVFIKGRDALRIASLERGRTDDPARPHAVTVTLVNDGEQTISAPEVDFYLTGDEGFVLREQMPFATLHTEALEPGAARSVACSFPEIDGAHRVTAVASGTVGKQRFADTACLLLTPVYIAKILPVSTPDKGLANHYPYLELVNPTAAALSLDGYRLARRSVAGGEPEAHECLALDGYTLPAGGRLVIWRRPSGAALTAADFNAHYRSALTEGENLLITEAEILLDTARGCRVELLSGDELLCRAAYGNYCRTDATLTAGRALRFAPAYDMTPNEQPLPDADDPTPGAAGDDEALPLVTVPAIEKGDKSAVGGKRQSRILTKLAHAPLVPLQTASLLGNALSAVKHFLKH
ncbi:MAG: CehA/McbA family metallohydrolase [Clostridia bacterium]|nr:CehA/McbA family metallohydrolase [Clostridia bacterium]